MKNLLLGPFFVLAMAAALWAECQCPSMTPQDQKDQATYIFTASVYDLRHDKKLNRDSIVFDVDDTFKGEPGQRVEVHDAEAGTECAFDFKEGDNYKVFAQWEWGNVVVSSCTGTSRIDPLAKLHALGPSDEEKEKIYKLFWEHCLGLHTTACCVKSVTAMSEGHFLPESEQGCPSDQIPDRLKCAGSYRWCIPMTGDAPDHRKSAPK